MVRALDLRVILVGIILIGLLVLAVYFFPSPERFAVGHVSADYVVMSISILPEYVYPEPGKSVIFEVFLAQLGGNPIRKDLVIRTFIIDEDGDKWIMGSETTALETRASMVLSPYIPDVDPGRYILLVEAYEIDGSTLVAQTSQTIIVQKPSNDYFSGDHSYINGLFVVAGVLLIVVVSLVIFILFYFLHDERKRA